MRGHHKTPTGRYMLRLLWVGVRHPHAFGYMAHLMRERWRHRHCDTVDFHHMLGCAVALYDDVPAGERS